MQGKWVDFSLQSWCWISEKAQLQGFFFCLINCCDLNVGVFFVCRLWVLRWIYLFFFNLKDNDRTCILSNKTQLEVFVDYAISLIIILAKSSANYNYCVLFEIRNLQKVMGTIEPPSTSGQNFHWAMEERNQHKRSPWISNKQNVKFPVRVILICSHIPAENLNMLVL